jgi:enoyl-CoA hydratase/carnithine racemase
MFSLLSPSTAGNVGKSATTTYTAPDEHDTFEPPTAAALQGRTMAGGCEDKDCQHCDEVSATVHVPVLCLYVAYTLYVAYMLTLLGRMYRQAL